MCKIMIGLILSLSVFFFPIMNVYATNDDEERYSVPSETYQVKAVYIGCSGSANETITGYSSNITH